MLYSHLNGLLDVGSQALKFARALLITEHQFNLSSRVSALKRCLRTVTPCLWSYKRIITINKLPDLKDQAIFQQNSVTRFSKLTKCILRAFLSPCCNLLWVSNINVFSLEQTSRGASETGSSVKQSCIDICSEGATFPSSSGYFQK